MFGLAFYENNTDKLSVATMSGVEPSVETIADGKYPVSRPLFFYVKKAHIGVIPGLKEYVEFFASDKMIGEEGPLADYGLVPLPKKEFDESPEASQGHEDAVVSRKNFERRPAEGPSPLLAGLVKPGNPSELTP